MLQQIRDFIDWRFLRSLAAVFVATALLLAVWTTATDNAKKGKRLDTLVAQGQIDRHEASLERQELLRGQRDLQAKYDGLLRSNRALLLYLQDNGIRVPAELIPAENTDAGEASFDGPKESSKSRSTSNTANDSAGKSHQPDTRPNTAKPKPEPRPGGKGAGHGKGHGRDSGKGNSHGTAKGRGAGHSQDHGKAKGHH